MNHLSGVRLSFCTTSGASLRRVSYPNRIDLVDFSSNYYDVKATDDMLIFQVSSKATSSQTATFMWGPSQ